MERDRRRFLVAAALGAPGLAALVPSVRGDDKKERPEEEVAAAEDLMREHGLLNRVLLIYEEALRRLRGKEAVGPEVYRRTATLVRKFVQDYHEKLEENFIFPAFEKRDQHVELVQVLRKQHQAGRDVTDVVLRNAAPI